MDIADNVVPSVETYGPSSERIKNLHGMGDVQKIVLLGRATYTCI